jgi:hypothetical protein
MAALSRSEGFGLQETMLLLNQLNPVSARRRASRKAQITRGWSDLTQTLHPSRPAVAYNLEPAGSLSHECGVNSSRAFSKLPSRTNSSIPP